MFSALAFTAAGSASASPGLWLAALALLCGGAWLSRREQAPPGITLLGISVAALGTWIVVTNVWANPSYTAAAPYYAAFLIGGFLLGRRAGVSGAAALFGVAAAFAVAVSFWALWQWFADGELRARSVFITPATLGSTINLVLLPALALFVLHPAGRRLLPLIVVLVAALAVAQSRGAWIALACAAAAAAMLAWRAGPQIRHRRLAIMIGTAAGVIVALLTAVLVFAPSWTDRGSFGERMLLNELALKGIHSSSWVVGAGYHSFYYLLESARPLGPAYVESTTYFVHNDYLQVFFELGVPGFAGLLAIVLLPMLYAWRAVARGALTERQSMTLVAAFAATASMAVHALGDFPFYIPVCVLLYGAALGILDATVLEADPARALRLPALLGQRIVRRAFVAAAATVSAWVLVVPAAAEAASEYAQWQWRAGKGQEAALWFETARRLDPRDWRYHWYAGQFWMAQAVSRGDPSAAALADRALADACAANRRDVRPLTDRVVLHDRAARLLPAPARPETLLGWAELAVRLAPADAAARVERDRLASKLAARPGG